VQDYVQRNRIVYQEGHELLVVLQNVKLQNAESQNGENTKRLITKRRLQNVESYKR
jgi:hypothetical protein